MTVATLLTDSCGLQYKEKKNKILFIFFFSWKNLFQYLVYRIDEKSHGREDAIEGKGKGHAVTLKSNIALYTRPSGAVIDTTGRMFFWSPDLRYLTRGWQKKTRRRLLAIWRVQTRPSKAPGLERSPLSFLSPLLSLFTHLPFSWGPLLNCLSPYIVRPSVSPAAKGSVCSASLPFNRS